MDVKESSAMTEASGLASKQEGTPAPSTAHAGSTARVLPSPDDLIRWADRLREVTVKAPLQSLFAAFVLGVWVARRR
ncbi:hypothetical protein [Bradyrhizobium sp. 25ACV]